MTKSDKYSSLLPYVIIKVLWYRPNVCPLNRLPQRNNDRVRFNLAFPGGNFKTIFAVNLRLLLSKLECFSIEIFPTKNVELATKKVLTFSWGIVKIIIYT